MIGAGLVARARSLWRGVRGGGVLPAEMEEEFRHHIELRAADLVREGLDPVAARRRARLEFGSAERWKHEGRRSRGLAPIDALGVSWLDFKLGFRMLVKYPGLTLVGGLAIAFAIWMGAATFELVTQVLRPTLPLPEAHRLVGLQLWDAEANRAERRLLHDFAAWRADLRTVQDLGAFRTVSRNLITGEGRGEPIAIAEISAAAFRIGVPPLLGRGLVDGDELPGAPPVVVLGHDVWQARFAGDPAVIGETVRLGATRSTVVGVMPEGFAFPVSDELWVPLRQSVLEHGRREGPGLYVFGRLAPGASLDEAQAELTALGRRAAADFPETHEHLRPQVMPYAKSIFNVSGLRSVGVMSVNIPLLLLLALVCANVALLLFARAATRESEILVRTALGASRSRIVMQLFAEALVLGTVAAAIGLAAAGVGLRWVHDVVEAELLEGGRLPFWFSDSLSPTTILYAAVLTVLGAVIAGVLPALKVTRGLSARLKAASAGGGGLRFGGVWTFVIVTQVAVTVAFPVIGIFTRRDAQMIRAVEVPFPEREYLTARLMMDPEPLPGAPVDTSPAAVRARYATTYAELARRLREEPGVVGVTYADRLPRMYHPHSLVLLDDGGSAPVDPRWPSGHRVGTASVDPAFFDVLDVPILRGRGFHTGDLATEGTGGGVLVNESFVELVLGGRNPIGRRIRYVHSEDWTEERERELGQRVWYEIVGVVPDLAMSTPNDPKRAGFYHAVPPANAFPMQLAVRVRGNPVAFTPRLRTIAAEADPTLRLYDTMSLAALSQTELDFLAFWLRILYLVCGVALTLSLAGIYAVMSFTVARRTREIGVRVALGANPRRVLLAIFRRPLIQVTTGVVAGAVLIGSLIFGVTMADGGRVAWQHVVALAAYALFMLGVCLLACVVPTRRALRVQPTEALRAEG